MNPLSKSLRIGVVRGGPSSEYDLSLQTGKEVLKHLSETHSPIDIFISRDGKWHIQGIERSPERILKTVDVVFNATHGTFGEDGTIQDILSHHGVPFTGSDKYTSAISMNKWLTKDIAIKAGIKTPIHIVVREDDSIEERSNEIFNSIPHPLIIKPARSGSYLGIYVAENFSELVNALDSVLSNHGPAIVEEFINGREVSCLVLDDFRGQDVYAFPPTIKLTRDETELVENISKQVHQLMGLRHYSKSDFIVSPKRGVYFLEVNTSPKFTEKSPILKTISGVGVSMKDFLHHVIGLAVKS